MKAQRQAVQVTKHIERHAAHCALRHAHKHHVAQFRKHGIGKTQEAVGHQQQKRYREQLLRGRQVIDYRLHQQRHAHVGELGRDEKSQGKRDTPFVFPQER